MNVNKFMNDLLAAYGDSTGAKNVNEFRTKLEAAVQVAAGTDGLSAGTVQEALQDLATRVQALEDA